MDRRRLLRNGLAATAAGLPGVALAQGGAYGGTVLYFRPPASHYLLLRQGQRITVADFLALEPGDELSLLSMGAAITYRDGNRPSRTLRAGGKPVTIQGSPRRTRFGNLAALILGKALAEADGLPLDGGARDGELSLPFPDLNAGVAVVDSRSGPFFAAWNKGVQPYRIRLETGQGERLFDELEYLHDRLALTSRPITLRPGPHRLTVTDSKKTLVTGRFEVRVGTAPDRPDDPDAVDAVTIHDAVQLVVEEPNRRFEAFQRLAALRGRRRDAARLSDWLAAGAPPVT